MHKAQILLCFTFIFTTTSFTHAQQTSSLHIGVEVFTENDILGMSSQSAPWIGLTLDEELLLIGNLNASLALKTSYNSTSVELFIPEDYDGHATVFTHTFLAGVIYRVGIVYFQGEFGAFSSLSHMTRSQMGNKNNPIKSSHRRFKYFSDLRIGLEYDLPFGFCINGEVIYTWDTERTYPDFAKKYRSNFNILAGLKYQLL